MKVQSSANSQPQIPIPAVTAVDDIYSEASSRPELDLRCLIDLGVTSAMVQEIKTDPTGLPPSSKIRFDLIEVSNGGCSVDLSITAHEFWRKYQDNTKNSSRGSDDLPRSSLRLIFVEDPDYGDEATYAKTPSTKLSRPRLNATAIWLHVKLGLPITFFQFLSPTLNFRVNGSSCFTKNDHEGNPICLEGFYQNSHGLGAGPAHVYYSCSLKDPRTTTYLIYNIPKSARDPIVLCATTQSPDLLLRPLTIDVFLADDLLQMWSQKIGTLRSKLITYESEAVISNFSMAQSTKVLQDLHSMSQDFQVIRGNLLDLRDKLQFLLHVRESYLSLTLSKFQTEEMSITSITESLALLAHRINITGIWASNYYERASIRINLFFNLTTQADSHTNLSIARMTTKISVATQKDSSSMITIAAVTMFFLPGSFVSSIFSMVFFDKQSNSLGQTSLSVAPQWWLFPSVTIPLTAAVFAVWLIWQRRRGALTDQLPNIEVTDDDRLTHSSISSGLSHFNYEEKV